MKRWYKYIKPYLRYFILGPLCMIVEVIGEVLMPKFLANIINLGAAWQNLPGEIEKAQGLLNEGGDALATDFATDSTTTDFGTDGGNNTSFGGDLPAFEDFSF